MKKLHHAISPFRFLFYLLLSVVLTLFVIGYSYIKEKKKWSLVAKRIQTIQSLSIEKRDKQSINNAVRKKYSHTDHNYLSNHLESIDFLKKERLALINLLKNPSFTGNKMAEKRYAFLMGEANCLRFVEKSPHSGDHMQETTLMQAHTVEVDIEDLHNILVCLEGDQREKPQIIITDFELNKKTQLEGNQIFELNLKLLKREFFE
ncbi:MAG: hypothetical protein R3E91_03445 [Chlamydiales bacterium]